MKEDSKLDKAAHNDEEDGLERMQVHFGPEKEEINKRKIK